MTKNVTTLPKPPVVQHAKEMIPLKIHNGADVHRNYRIITEQM